MEHLSFCTVDLGVATCPLRLDDPAQGLSVHGTHRLRWFTCSHSRMSPRRESSSRRNSSNQRSFVPDSFSR